MLYYFAGFNGYLLLGHYLRNHDWTGRQAALIGVPMFVVGYAVTFFGFRHMTALPDFTDEMLELFFYLLLTECGDDDHSCIYVGKESEHSFGADDKRHYPI